MSGMTTLTIPFAALFGLIVGSFLNVCIYRLPREESIVRPRSHCPGCQVLIRWYENIPVLSYLFLRGKCRHCGRRISLRYPVVEILTAVLSVVIVLRFPSPAHYIAYFLFLSAPLLVITFIDLEHLIIPDVIVWPGIGLGLIVHLYLSPAPIVTALTDSLIGIAVGGGSLFLLGWVYEHMRGRVGLGLGDAKLAAMLGAFFGWRAIIFLLLLSSITGTVVGLSYILLRRHSLTHPIPYGPFLALAAWIYLFYGSQLLNWYLGWTSQLLNAI